MSEDTIKIAVSSCLLGESVRYDGTDKHIPYLTAELASRYCLVSICPEMAVGMGVPRPPIHLVGNHQGVQVLGVDDAGVNMTRPLQNYADEVVQKFAGICGYIFKKNSPSCGTKNVKVMSRQGEYERTGQGIYAQRIMHLLPLLPVIDEEELANKNERDRFLLDVESYAKKIVQT